MRNFRAIRSFEFNVFDFISEKKNLPFMDMFKEVCCGIPRVEGGSKEFNTC